MKVLIVCSGNSHRSPIAEALLKKLRPELHVESAGVEAADFLSRNARIFLEKENALQYAKRIPESLSEKKLEDFDLIIAMEEEHREAVLRLCPSCAKQVTVWNIHDPYLLPKDREAEIFSLIKAKVEELASSI